MKTFDPLTTSSRQADFNAAATLQRQDVGAIGDPANPRRRNSCRKNLLKFLRVYMADTFFLRFCDDQKEAVQRIEDAILNGGLSAIAMPRGFGKTSISAAAAIWGTLYGHLHYCVILGSDKGAADAIMTDIKAELFDNDRLLEDFPEACKPIVHLENKPQRCASQHVSGDPTRMKWTGDKIVLPTVKKPKWAKACGSVIQGKGLTGGIRGLHHKTIDSKIRPDFVLLDDPQTRESARSFEQTETREKIIRGDVLGLAGHSKMISAVMPCTVIEEGDLADRFLERDKNPAWRGHRTKLVYAWGKKSVRPDSKYEYENSALWEAYAAIWNACKLNGDMAEANQFYRKNRKDMDAGVVVASKYFFDKSKELSAVQHAFNLKFQVGENAFLSEYQNEPVSEIVHDFKITSENVSMALNHMEHRTAPNDAQYLTACIDVNDLGLNWAVIAFDSNRAGWVLDYGKYPGGNKFLWSPSIGARTGISEEKTIYAGIMHLGEKLMATEFSKEDGSRIYFNAIMFDANYLTSTVAGACRALSRKLNFHIWLSRSRPTKRYRIGKGAKCQKAAQDVHLEKTDRGFECVYASDRWQKDAQYGFKLPAGAPNSLSLWGNSSTAHKRIGDEMTAEKLLQLLRGDIHDSYTWSPPAGRNDLLDAVKGCIAAAALLGAGQAEDRKRPRKRKSSRRAKVQKIKM